MGGGRRREPGREDAVWGGEAVVVEQQFPHSRVVAKNQEGYLGSEQSQPQARLCSPGFQLQEGKASRLLAVKTSGGWGSRRNCWFLRRVCLRAYTVLEHTQTHPLWESSPGQQQEGRHLHMGSGWSAWKWGECQASFQRPGSSTAPSLTPPPTWCHKVVKWVALPWWIPKAPPLTT